MRKVVAECPGSCGEFIQGYINGKKMLVSYPVDMYSKVTLELKKSDNSKLSSKLREALIKTCKFLHLPKSCLDHINCQVETKLPIGKGMASSTADIGAAVLAFAALFDYQMTAEEIASIALSIEPTDSIVFPSITLFDYISGNYSEDLGTLPALEVIVLEGYGTVNTLEFNKLNHQEIIWQNRELLQNAFILLKQGIKAKDYTKVGQAALLSARANQNILPKQYLEEVVELSMALNAAGVNVAHSGTVLGVFYDSSVCDGEKIAKIFREENWRKHFKNVYMTKVVEGGAKLI